MRSCSLILILVICYGKRQTSLQVLQEKSFCIKSKRMIQAQPVNALSGEIRTSQDFLIVHCKAISELVIGVS